jgi:hypothetical protein
MDCENSSGPWGDGFHRPRDEFQALIFFKSAGEKRDPPSEPDSVTGISGSVALEEGTRSQIFIVTER